VFRAFDEPVRLSLVPQLVDRARLPNAVALGSIPWQAGRMIGPSITGILIAAFGGAVGLGLAAGASCAAVVTLPSGERRLTVTGRDAIAGRYETRLSSRAPDVERLGLAGRYELRLGSNGALTLVSPPDVGMPGPPISFTVEGRSFTTNLLVGQGCHAPGVYRWSLDDGVLALAPVADTCEIRSTVLATRAWRAVAEASSVDALQGEWISTYSCEEMVAAVERAPVSRHDESFWREANAREFGSPDQDDPCAGSVATITHTLRFTGDRLQIFDLGPAEGFDGRYRLRGGILTIRDPRTRNIAGAYRLRVDIGDDSLTFELLDRGARDPWFVSTWQVAPFARVR